MATRARTRTHTHTHMFFCFVDWCDNHIVSLQSLETDTEGSPKGAIKHYGTFGSPKIAEHVHFTQKVQWEQDGELVWEHQYVEYARDLGNIYGNQCTWLGHNVRQCTPLPHNVRGVH
jgi:hypothetical protein